HPEVWAVPPFELRSHPGPCGCDIEDAITTHHRVPVDGRAKIPDLPGTYMRGPRHGFGTDHETAHDGACSSVSGGVRPQAQSSAAARSAMSVRWKEPRISIRETAS